MRNVYQTDFEDRDFRTPGITQGPWVILSPIRRSDLEPDGAISLYQDEGPLSVMLWRIVSVGTDAQDQPGIYNGAVCICMPAINSISPANTYKVCHYEEIIQTWPSGYFN